MTSRTGMHLVPNPTSSRSHVHFTLPTATPADIRIHDISGREVWRTSIEGPRTGTVRLPLLPAGVYLVRLESDTFTATEKLVVQR